MIKTTVRYSLYALPVVLGTLSSSATALAQETTLLQTSLDDAAAIGDPATGLGGTTNLVAEDFVAGPSGAGASMSNTSFISFPAGDGVAQNIELDQGSLEFWYRPNYDAAADDLGHTLFLVGNIYGVPRFHIVESDALRVVMMSDWGSSITTSSEWRAPLWAAGDWVKIRVVWDTHAAIDALQIFVNDTRVDVFSAPGGWDLGSEAAIGNMYIGGEGSGGGHNADGIIDELVIKTGATGGGASQGEGEGSGGGSGGTITLDPDVLFYCTMDDSTAIATPLAGLGGESSLSAGEHVTGYTAQGAQMISHDYLRFPLGNGTVKNIDLEAGSVEMWYRPNYDAAADDVSHALFVVGNIYGVPRMALVEGETLSFAMVSDWGSQIVTHTEWRAPVWTAGAWVHIRASWDNSRSADALQIFVNDVRVDTKSVAGGWDLGAESALGHMYIGSGDQAGTFFADGIIDDVIIREGGTVGNAAPIAEAGADASLAVGSQACLDGRQSADDNTDAADLSYAWSITTAPAGFTATLDDPTSATPCFSIPTSGDYTVELIVTDAGGLASEPDTVTISSLNSAPTADAGLDRSVLAGELVTLDGTQSADADGHRLTYAWSLTDAPAGSTAQIQDATFVNPYFTPDLVGTYRIQLVVHDGYVGSAADEITINVGITNNNAVFQVKDAMALIKDLPNTSLRKRRHKRRMLRTLNRVVGQINRSRYVKAKRVVERMLRRTDSCIATGSVDHHGRDRDWITTCADQLQIHAELSAARTEIDILINNH